MSPSTLTWTQISRHSAGWKPLSTMSSALLDVGVDFVLRASDEKAVLAFDGYRGAAAHDGPLLTPP